MAVSFGGFSIREYTSKMRSVDVRNCWPFGETDDGEIQERLPPMICRKYVWWSDVLETARSEKSSEQEAATESGGLEKELQIPRLERQIEGEEAERNLGLGEEEEEEEMVKICPVCEKFTATTINAMNAHIDSCLAKASVRERRQIRLAKAKLKTPKKRSIVEIFAVSPLVDTVEDDDDEEFDSEADERSDSDVFKAKMLKREQKKEKLRIRKKKKMLMMKKKKKLLKNALSKGKFKKLRMPHGVDCPQLLSRSSPNKNFGKKIAGLRKRKMLKLKNTPMENQVKIIQASKLITRLQGEASVIPVQSILKNQSKVTSAKKLPAKGNLKGASFTKKSHLKNLNRRVRFCGKDDIIEPTMKWCTSLEMPQMPIHGEAFPNVMDQLVENNRDLLVTNEIDGASGKMTNDDVNVRQGIGASSSHERKNFANAREHVGSPSFSESVDLNQTFQSHDSFHQFYPDNSISPHDLSCLVIQSRFNSKHSEGGYGPNVEIHTEASVSRGSSSTRDMTDSFPVTTRSSLDCRETIDRNATSLTSQSTLSRDMEACEKRSYLSQATGHNSNPFYLECPPLCHLSPKDLMSSICSSVELKKQLQHKRGQFGEPRAGSKPVSVYKDNYFDEDFIGLPLNSQGELIQLHSNAKVGFNQLMNKQPSAMGSGGSFPKYNLVGPMSEMARLNAKEKLNSMTRFPVHYVSPTNIPGSSGLGFTDLQDLGRTESRHQELNLMNLSCHAFREPNERPDKHAEMENVRGKRNLHNWSHPTGQPTVRLMGKNVSLGKSNEGQGSEDGKIWTDKEIITEHHPSVVFADNTMQRQQITPVSSMTKRTGNQSVDVQSIPNLQRLLPAGEKEPSFSHASHNCSPHFVSRNCVQHINRNHDLGLPCFPHQLPSSRNYISGANSDRVRRQKPLSISKSSNTCIQHMVQFPFPNQDSVAVLHGQAQHSPPSLPQWLQAAARQKEIASSSLSVPSYSFANRNEDPLSGSNCLPLSSRFIATTIPVSSHDPNNCHSCQASFFAHPSLVPAVPEFRPTSARDAFRNNNSMWVGEKINSTCYHDHSKKTKKRPGSKADDSTKSMKKPNLDVQDGTNTLMGLKGREQFGHKEYDPEIMGVRFPGLETEKERLRALSGVSSSRMDSVARFGPIKLSAGAKHILKPSQNTDQDNSMPIHSTIPFVGVADTDKLPDFQKKTAKVYRF